MQSDRRARTGSAGGSDPITGRLLDGRYRIGARIARGGMASVYEATDLRLDRVVAVKIMHPGLGDDDEFAARFVREARSAARLSHPHVVAVYDQGEEHGTVYLAMELVSGHTLRDVIRTEGPMAPARALALLEPVLSALAAAHRAGLVHRDVKPENVLIADDGRVKVADFGLAKAVSADTQHTATGGVLIGTVSYLAPELVVDGRADARADVYAAGVVLYELLTGAKPHEGESPIQVAYKHVHEDVPPPSRLVPGLPAYVDALVARATARDRGLRSADAGVLLHQLHQVASALADGVQEDPELTTDLAPFLLHPDTGRVVAAEEPGARVNTASDPFDADELAALLAPSPAGSSRLGPSATRSAGASAGASAGPSVSGHTTSLDRTLVPGPARTSGATRLRHDPSGPWGDSPGEPPGSPPRRSHRGAVLLVLALLLVVGAGVGAWWFGFARYTATPAVIGLAQATAETRLTAAGLDVRLAERAYSETVAAGRVIGTDPGAGSRILDGGTVTVVVSLGKERYDVPRTKGLTEDSAKDELAQTHLTFGTSLLRFSETVPEGTVLGSDPRPGTTLRPGAVVDLIVSKGPRPIRVRDWTGRDADRAEEQLTASGLEVDRSEEFSDTVPAGQVLTQSPSGGTLTRGDTVRLVVSKGPELVEMPGVLASGIEAAREELEALGFVVRIENAAGYLGLGYVFGSDPEGGELVPRGSTVTLYQV